MTVNGHRIVVELDEKKICAQLAEALVSAGGTHDLARDVWPMLRDGRAQWWTRGQGAIVTEIIAYPNRKIVNYWLVAGDLLDCLALQADIDAWAIAQGCDTAVAVGRKGWVGVLPGHGWQERGVAWSKPLKGARHE